MCGMRRTSTSSNDEDMNCLSKAISQDGNLSANQSLKSNSTTECKIVGDSNNNDDSNSYIEHESILEAGDQKDWSSCRKRKERQDSTSSMTQDRKLVRSSSEELLMQCQETIRRASSHEDFKKPIPFQLHNNTKDHFCSDDFKKIVINADTENIPDTQCNSEATEIGRSQKSGNFLSSTDYLHECQIETENDHEVRRNKERFVNLKGRSPGRKSSSSKKLSKKPSEKHLHHKTSSNSASTSSMIDAADDTVSFTSDYDKPWYNSLTEYTPVLCQRFADPIFEHSINLREKHSKESHHYDNTDRSSKSSYTNFMNAENTKTRDLMQRKYSDILYHAPDDRVKQINKRLVSLKKKITSYEEHFERNYGYRPSHADKANDKSVKKYIAEINRLRKEKTQMKQDPLLGTEFRSQNETSREKRIEKLKDTMFEIEKRLYSRRFEEGREDNIELMKADQLIQEKTSVQKALLYLESIFGRPCTKEERDIARPLYDRYRILKRMVNRNNSLSGPSGGPELPTILENEALAFPSLTTPSTDISPPSIGTSILQSPSSDDTSTSTSMEITFSQTENNKLHSMSTEQLWKHYDSVKEEKKELRRTIKEFERDFEEKNCRKMLKSDRKILEETYDLYKEKKAKLRLLDALLKKQISK